MDCAVHTFRTRRRGWIFNVCCSRHSLCELPFGRTEKYESRGAYTGYIFSVVHPHGLVFFPSGVYDDLRSSLRATGSRRYKKSASKKTKR